MPDFIWQWIKGNTKFFTKKMETVKKAIKEGCLVTRLKTPSRIISDKKNTKRGKAGKDYPNR